MVGMKKINIYSNGIQLVIRIISLLAIIILVSSNTRKVDFLNLEESQKFNLVLFSFVVNCISIFLFFLLVVFPTRIEILSLLASLYGITIILFEPQNNMGILMCGLSLMSLYARGMFNKHKRIKEVIVFSFLTILTFSELRFGKEIFINCFFEKLVYSFVFLLCLFFMQAYVFDVFETNTLNCKLDIQKFPELKKRDAEWLFEILNGEKYESISIDYHMSLGSVKNRFKVIFNEIGVGDKKGFLNKYSDYEICYGDDFSSIKKKKKKKKLFNI